MVHDAVVMFRSHLSVMVVVCSLSMLMSSSPVLVVGIVAVLLDEALGDLSCWTLGDDDIEWDAFVS